MHPNTGIEEVTDLASGSRTTTQSTGDLFNNYGPRAALIVTLDVTDVSASPSITVNIEGKDAASGKYYTILAGAAVVTAVTNRYRVGPDLAASANAIAQDHLPAIYRIRVVANNANAGIYSLGHVIGR